MSSHFGQQDRLHLVYVETVPLLQQVSPSHPLFQRGQAAILLPTPTAPTPGCLKPWGDDSMGDPIKYRAQRTTNLLRTASCSLRSLSRSFGSLCAGFWIVDSSINLLNLVFRRSFSGIISNKIESLNPRMCGRASEVKRRGRTWTKTVVIWWQPSV